MGSRKRSGRSGCVRITLQFVLNGNTTPAAVTGVDGQVTDLILPSPGDYVEHRDFDGEAILGRVTRRSFRYLLSDGDNVEGEVAVVIWLDRVRFSKSADGHN